MNEHEAWKYMWRVGLERGFNYGLCDEISTLFRTGIISERTRRKMRGRIRRVQDLTGLAWLWPMGDQEARIGFCRYQVKLSRPLWQRLLFS